MSLKRESLQLLEEENKTDVSFLSILLFSFSYFLILSAIFENI